VAFTAKREPIVPAKSPARAKTLEPQVAEPKPPGRVTFQSDPIADGAIIGVSLGFAYVLGQINSTGEIRPQQIERTFDRSQLLAIDRAAVNQNVDPNASVVSNIGLWLAGTFAVVDPILSGYREKSVQAGIVDAVSYAETAALTTALTNLVKMAVRRPRPIAYQELEKHRDDPNWSNTSTDSSLSFFSGHASMVAGLGATATYLAFARSPKSARPWVTLGLATVVTTVVSIERVRAGKHFPTDVIAGAVAGAGIGIVVPHLHRTEDVQQRRVWVGFAPARERDQLAGGTLTLSGFF
jgi:undecaprenyl-diphosphatase